MCNTSKIFQNQVWIVENIHAKSSFINTPREEQVGDPSSIMLVPKWIYYKDSTIVIQWMLNCYRMLVWILRMIYYSDIVYVKLLRNACMSITKDLLLWFSEC